MGEEGGGEAVRTVARMPEAVLTKFDSAKATVARAREALLKREFSHHGLGQALQALRRTHDGEMESEGGDPGIAPEKIQVVPRRSTDCRANHARKNAHLRLP